MHELHMDATEEELTELDVAWHDAFKHRNQQELQRLMTDDFLSVSPEGMVMNKSQVLEALHLGGIPIRSYRLEQQRLRIYGDFAILVGRSCLNDRLHVSYTQVWVRQEKGWRIASFQGTEIAGCTS